ncbi:hypothetical protein LCGC14_2382990, partial [marine sediment metagenome]
GGKIYEMIDLIGSILEGLLFTSRNYFPSLEMRFNSDNITIVPQMFIQIIGTYTADDAIKLYYGTYNFKDEAIGTSGTDIDFVDAIDGAMSAIIESSLGDHRKILKLTATAGDSRYIKHDFADQTTDQTVEWWFRLPSVAASTYYNFYFYDSSNTLAIKMFVQDNDIYRMNGGLNKILDAGVIVDTWHHIKLSWDLTFDTVDTYFDGILIEDNGDFYNMVSNIAYVEFKGYHAASDVVIYMDALGVSWDDNYLIGDNLHYNNFLGSETFENYNQTYSGDYYGTESFDYYTEDEVYYGTYDFRDEIGETGTDIDLLTSLQADIAAEVIALYENHKAVLKLTSTAASSVWHYVSANPTGGTIEMYYISVVGAPSFRLEDEGGHMLLYLVSYPDGHYNFGYGDGIGGTTNIHYEGATSAFPHIKITFDCATDKYSGWIDGVLVVDNENFATDHDGVYVDRVRWYFNAGAIEMYVDAYGESWDTTSHSGLGYTVDYNILSQDIEPILQGGYEIDNINFGDSLEVVNVLDGHNNVVNITGSTNFAVI